jgi:hypothetical protein
MAIDKEITDAVENVFNTSNQPEKSSKRFIAWLKDLSSRELSKNENLEHLDMLRKALRVEN